MKASFKAHGRKHFACGLAISFLLVLAMAGGAAAEEAGPEDTIAIVLDQSRIIRIPDRTATVVVGNPLIADVVVQPGGLMVLTGKGYGNTNLVALDGSGNTLLAKELLVVAPKEVVVVYRGIHRESYSCTPDCERRIMLGDAQPFFTQALTQTVTRNAQASGIK
jgi:Flp pilus assembly secretin CpaC